MTFCTSSVQDGIQYFKYAYSTLLMIFCVILVMACIVTGQSKAALYNIHPALAIILFWLLIGWLAIMEGGQGCLVGLKPMDKNAYKDTHNLSFRCCKIAHKGVNLERFIVGRQFLVVLVIFLINMMGEAQPGADPLHLPDIVNSIFLGNSLAMILTVIDIGQLPAQVTASMAMLDFIQSYIFLGTTYISLAIEFSGLLHSVYIVQYAFEWMAGTKYSGPEKSIVGKIFFWGRVLMSTGILFFAFAVTLTAIIQGNSGMWNGVPPWASIIIFFVLLCVVGLMEGMQIAAFALLNMPEEELVKHKIAHKSCTLMFKGENLQSFLVGRQIFVALLMFIVARIATISISEGEANIFNVSDGFQSFLDTGLLGAIILTVVGSLVWRVIASSLPLLFMSNPILYVIIRACFILEAIGICAVSWLISICMKRCMRARSDDEYFVKDFEAATELDLESSQQKMDDYDSDEDDDLPEERQNDATPYGRKSMREILLPEGDSMGGAVHKMKAAMVQSARYSAVMSTRDIDMLMADLKTPEDNDSDSDSDDDDLRGDKKNDTPLAKKSLRDFSSFLTTKQMEDDDEEEDVGDTPLAKKSMRDIIGAIFNAKNDGDSSDDDSDDEDDDLPGEKEETPLGKKSMKNILGNIFSSKKRSANHDNDDDSDDDDDDDDLPEEKKDTPLGKKSMREIYFPDDDDDNNAGGKIDQMKSALVKSAIAARNDSPTATASATSNDTSNEEDDDDHDGPETSFRDVEEAMDGQLESTMDEIRRMDESSTNDEKV